MQCYLPGLQLLSVITPNICYSKVGDDYCIFFTCVYYVYTHAFYTCVYFIHAVWHTSTVEYNVAI